MTFFRIYDEGRHKIPQKRISPALDIFLFKAQWIIEFNFVMHTPKIHFVWLSPVGNILNPSYYIVQIQSFLLSCRGF